MEADSHTTRFLSTGWTRVFPYGPTKSNRVPDYSRVDVRLSKAFLFKRWKLTITGEVIKLLNKDNVRFAGFDGFGANGRVFGQLDRLLPILPSAGVVIDSEPDSQLLASCCAPFITFGFFLRIIADNRVTSIQRETVRRER
jgi:hypothetical protein